MPKTTRSKKSSQTRTSRQGKRHGKHHKKKRSYIKVYAPYLPLIISIIASLLISYWQPKNGNTLAYSVEMSSINLLNSTNSQRANNGRGALSINQKLSSAAQAKANHMVANNYWSHVTPDGQQPWVFIQNAGYEYDKAGENLAYGFPGSNDVVIGWMNSPTHKDNMLDPLFTEVGFGFANSPSYNGDGEQTVVVAMYGMPSSSSLTAPAPMNPPATPTTGHSLSASNKAALDNRTQSNMDTLADPQKDQQNSSSNEKNNDPQNLTAAPTKEKEPPMSFSSNSQNIAKAQTLTNGNAPWTFGLVITFTVILVMFIVLRYGIKIRKIIKGLVKDTEKFVLHHPLLDSIVIGLIILGLVLMQTAGTIL